MKLAGIRRVKGPQSRAWKVLTTVRVDGERWQGLERLQAWWPGSLGSQAGFECLQGTLAEMVGRLTPAWQPEHVEKCSASFQRTGGPCLVPLRFYHPR